MDCIEMGDITHCLNCRLFDDKKFKCFYLNETVSNVYQKLDNCPIKKDVICIKKPKELEFHQIKDTNQYVADVGFAEYVIKSEYCVDLKFSHHKGWTQSITVSEDGVGLEENKKKAQEHYDGLFIKMIRG